VDKGAKRKTTVLKGQEVGGGGKGTSGRGKIRANPPVSARDRRAGGWDSEQLRDGGGGETEKKVKKKREKWGWKRKRVGVKNNCEGVNKKPRREIRRR